MVETREWLIKKDGYFYRPNFCGYTTSKFEAGRYTKTEADREAVVEPWHMKAIHQDDVEDDPVSSRVRMDADRIEALERQLAEARAEYLSASKDAMELAGELNAAEAERDRLAAEMDRVEQALCCAEHGHNINEVLANYRAIRRAIKDRRAALAGKE